MVSNSFIFSKICTAMKHIPACIIYAKLICTLLSFYIVARCAPAAATVQVLGVNLLLTPTCHES
jgi:hypothetical protein